MASAKVLIVCPHGPPAFGLEVFYERAFRRLGFETILVAANGKGGVVGRIHAWGGKLRRRGMKPRGMCNDVAEIATRFRPLLSLVVRGDALRPESVEHLQRSSSLGCACVFQDSPFALLGKNAYGLYNTFAAYDIVYSFSRALVPVFYQLGASDVRWLPFAADVEMSECKRNDMVRERTLSYFGTWGPLQERWLRPLMRHGLEIYGDGWGHLDKHDELRRAWRNGEGRGWDMFGKISVSRVVVNLIRAEHGCGHSMKTFEIPAAGGLMVTNRTEEQELFFEDGVSCLFFDTLDQLQATIDKALLDREFGRDIAEHGREVASKNTYEERARTILNDLGWTG